MIDGIVLVSCPHMSQKSSLPTAMLQVAGSKDSWDFGEGAGFYLDATQPGWEKWKMYTYITSELPQVLSQFPELNIKRVSLGLRLMLTSTMTCLCLYQVPALQASISGHSMGGHGALTLGLKNPDKYASISAFAPISHPSAVPWGQKAFKGYLSTDEQQWKQYDATELAQTYSGPEREILVDQGTADNFLKVQLDPSDFRRAVEGNPKLKLNLRMQACHLTLRIAAFLACMAATERLCGAVA